MKFILRYLELVFTVVGLAVIFGVTALFSSRGTSTWQIAAITAGLVGVIHGVLFWLVRRRQRDVRRAAITEIQSMLRDEISKQLKVIEAMSVLRESRPDETKRACDYISRAVTSIDSALELLSEESLRSWRARAGATRPSV